jgi:GNAT superfamily N-acetyltransferase
MADTVIEKVDEGNFDEFTELIIALAKFERLTPPDGEALGRLRDHALGAKPLFEAFLARQEGRTIAYLILLHTYSSFLAKPTLYIEDIFVLEEHRKKGIGKELFVFSAKKAQSMGCGRMEWQALDWNKNAIDFYLRLGGRPLSDWVSFRMDERALEKLVNDSG